MTKQVLKSLAAKNSAKTIFVNCSTTSSFYTFFNAGLCLSAGNDMNAGSSFGIPSGTVPSNNVNQILNEMPVNNPFLLRKVRIKHTFSATPLNTSPVGFNVQLANTPTTGHAAVMRMDGTKVIDPEDEQTLVYDFEMNVVIDGQRTLQITPGTAPAGWTGYIITFYIDAIADVYEFSSN